jgi:hypothetical protein
MASNELFLAVLPLANLGTGQTGQYITLFPDRGFATEFFPDDVDDYIGFFQARLGKYLTGGHVKGYEFHKEATDDGRFVVRVTQNVG